MSRDINLEPPDYETPLKRSLLVNKISEWYDKKFANETKRFKQVSIFDLIADFIMDTNFSQQHPKERKVSLDDIKKSIENVAFFDGDKMRCSKIALIMELDNLLNATEEWKGEE